MKLFKQIPLSFEEKEYEVRVYSEDRAINIVVFLDNYPATGFRHQIMVPKKHNAASFIDSDPVQELIEISKTDITEKRWERLLN